MPLLKNINPIDRFLGLFIGRSGSGKTAAALSFPKPLKVLDLDGRIRGGIVPWNDLDGIEYTFIPSKPDKGTVFDLLNNEFSVLDINSKKGDSDLQTLVFDSLTWGANDLLLDAIPLTHKPGSASDGRGRSIGTMQVAGPDDYKFQSTGIVQILAFLKSLKIPNIILTANIVNRWGRPKDQTGKIIDPYGPSEVVGEQLVLTDKISETAPSAFDNIFKFEKIDTGRELKFYFSAQGDLARNTLGIEYGNLDITGVNFYNLLQTKLVQPQAQTTTTKGV
jgi:hypothetical protein